eukprot:6003307-Prorocentrum_lima.AAC.1
MSAIPTAAGVEGVTRKLRQRFATDQGCPLGRKGQHEHPRDCPGKCFICGGINHISRECTRPRTSDGAKPKPLPQAS